MAKKKKKVAKKKTAKKAVKKAVKKAAKKTKKVAKKATVKKVKKAVKMTAKKVTKKVAKTAATKKAAPKKTAKPAAAAKTAAPEVNLLGHTAPALTLHDQSGENISLSEETEKNPYVVLYFYPKDDTPGCTKEACDFRDNLDRLTSNGVRVLGVSPDTSESHTKFVEKFQINFPLLADTEKTLSEKMGVWKLKKFMGREYMGVERSTFLFANGKVAKVWQPVSVEGHVQDVLNTVHELRASTAN